MLTDDDLSRRLETAFSNATSGLTYTGTVPEARRTPSAGWLALPVVAAVGVGLSALTTHPAPNPPSTSQPMSDAPVAHPAPMVTDTVTLAGLTLTYRHPAGEPDPLRSSPDPGPVPEDARPITAPDGVRAWVGTDPKSGDAALWVEAPTRNEGRLFALYSSVWTQDQLAELFHSGSTPNR
ncbi:hypothetical protein [Cryptosporangium japonicum]|uniref:DUF4245 domain-containing protein n=1 Tax=Cryptosporangium japonicum TaxID=80872 RepID=A0ABN0UXI6_9ACTN